MSKIAIIGSTTWGFTLGVVLARSKKNVHIWARTKQEAEVLRSKGPKLKRLPADFKAPANLQVSHSIEDVMADAEAVIMAIPSQTMRQNMRVAAPYLKETTLIISASKGLEIESGKRMSEVISEEIKPEFRENVCVLSGPNIAWEILHDLPAVTVVACDNHSNAKRAHRLITSTNFCAFTNTDMIGVELGGALKNIIALAAGIADGLGLGDNTKAALITRGITEITALGTSLGANPLTFSGLAGLGDLVVTCSSTLSRNHFVGVELAKGRSLKDITETMSNVAEGVTTTKVARNLAHKKGLEMPITERLYKVLYEGEGIQKMVAELMEDTASHELAGRRWKLFSLFKKRK